jgi:hypothetical protein
MGQQKRNYEKTIPVRQKQSFQKDLDFYLFTKEKSQTPIVKPSNKKQNG